MAVDELNSTSKCKKKKINEGEDRISSLPNNIIQDILSFLPTKDAVSTSVLSTRWKYMWTGISNLDFCYILSFHPTKDAVMFTNFVAKVLLLHDASVINKFRLNSKVALDTSWVNAWIYTVLRRKVRELIIELKYVGQPIVLPCSYLNCESLMIKCLDYNVNHYILLRLSMTCTHFDFEMLKKKNVDCIPNHLTSNSLSRLKVLHLSNIDISFDQESEQVSFNFPILEDALLKNCMWINVEAVNFFAPALKRLIVVVNDQIRDDEHCELKVYAQSLIILDVDILVSFDLSLYNLSSLYEASIDTYDFDYGGEDKKYCLSKILKAITNVRDLTLSGLTMDSIYDASLTKDLLALSNLKTLRVCSQDLLDGYILTKFFCYMPNIEALFFSEGLGNAAGRDTYGWIIKTTPRPLLSNLKLVEISDSNGHLNELQMVDFLLENARALKKITITASSTLRSDPQKQLEYAKELLLLPRDSACVMDFS